MKSFLTFMEEAIAGAAVPSPQQVAPPQGQQAPLPTQQNQVNPATNPNIGRPIPLSLTYDPAKKVLIFQKPNGTISQYAMSNISWTSTFTNDLKQVMHV